MNDGKTRRLIVFVSWQSFDEKIGSFIRKYSFILFGRTISVTKFGEISYKSLATF